MAAHKLFIRVWCCPYIVLLCSEWHMSLKEDCLPGGVVLVILAAIDAAFSGDWSRIGILSKDAELGLRPLLGLLGLFHIACGSVTALDAAQKGYNPVPQTLKAGLLCTNPV